jgi:hypothetical protein
MVVSFARSSRPQHKRRPGGQLLAQVNPDLYFDPVSERELGPLLSNDLQKPVPAWTTDQALVLKITAARTPLVTPDRMSFLVSNTTWAEVRLTTARCWSLGTSGEPRKIRSALFHEGGERLGCFGGLNALAEQFQFFADPGRQVGTAAAHQMFGLPYRLRR